ncbi:hypothetical protein L228DRAFT_244718 [Xylona heveae TC161]|uniref:Uncharacterized protein n=1 Tax=Xylona heveae (strain CBS 132557 / TC161) TaxID=1328760 RepID=A0A165J6F9_XYLHT|nr:hypothetical protein L228DRAFT_244718 [Xylona heveae TC161]KZF25798.1 hypothetical protein L228DRAFT_244718 [Xylona heveae TC161]
MTPSTARYQHSLLKKREPSLLAADQHPQPLNCCQSIPSVRLRPRTTRLRTHRRKLIADLIPIVAIPLAPFKWGLACLSDISVVWYSGVPFSF